MCFKDAAVKILTFYVATSTKQEMKQDRRYIFSAHQLLCPVYDVN